MKDELKQHIMNYTGKNGEYFDVVNITTKHCSILNAVKPNELSLLWFTNDDTELTLNH